MNTEGAQTDGGTGTDTHTDRYKHKGYTTRTAEGETINPEAYRRPTPELRFTLQHSHIGEELTDIKAPVLRLGKFLVDGIGTYRPPKCSHLR